MQLSDQALYDRFGDILHEIPELWTALRIFEMQERCAMAPGAFHFAHRRLEVGRVSGERPASTVQIANDV